MQLLYDKLQAHLGHPGVCIVSYDLEPGSADPHNISLECEDCGEVIVDTDAYELTAAEGAQGFASTQGDLSDREARREYCCSHRANETAAGMAARCDCVCHR